MAPGYDPMLPRITVGPCGGVLFVRDRGKSPNTTGRTHTRPLTEFESVDLAKRANVAAVYMLTGVVYVIGDRDCEGDCDGDDDAEGDADPEWVWLIEGLEIPSRSRMTVDDKSDT